MARSKPEHKYVLVDGINKLGHIVGVTGDGANDLMAIKEADVGIGISGTDAVYSSAFTINHLDSMIDIIK